MFVNDRIIYLQLQKTGCTHIARLLAEYLGGSEVQKHGRIDRDPGGRLVIGSVRDPWDWYVSLWAYGCMGRGAINTRLTDGTRQRAARILRESASHPRSWPGLPNRLARQLTDRDPAFWRRVYRDATDAGAFREWLHALHGASQSAVFEDNRALSLHDDVGLYTARLVFLYSDPQAWDRAAPSMRQPADLQSFYRDNKVVQRIIRTETIAADLAKAMADVGHPEITETELAAQERTNTSRRGGFETYHDASTIALVSRRDSFIAETFDYTPPAQVN